MDTYDFSRPPDLPEELVASLHAPLAAAAVRSGMLIAARLRLDAKIAVESIEVVSTVELTAHDQSPFLARLGDGVVGLVGASTPLVVELADVVMGGPGRVAARSATPLERELLARRLTAGLVPLADALGAMGLDRLELEPLTDTPTGLPERLLGVRLDIKLGDVAGLLTLALPADIAAAAPAGPSSDEAEVVYDANIAEALADVPINVAIQFDPVRLAAADVEHLEPGDVIRLEHPYGRPVLGSVDGLPWFLAHPGRHGRQFAVRVEHVLDHGARPPDREPA